MAANARISRRVTAGAMTPSPRATVRTASTSAVGVDVLEQEPGRAGPQRPEDVLVEVERGEHQHLRQALGDDLPAWPRCRRSRGIRTSSTATSGRSARQARTASSPSAASPTTSMSGARVQDQHQPGAHRRLVVGDHHPDHARLRAHVRRQLGAHPPEPAPSTGPADSRPASRSARSRMPIRPAPDPGRGHAGAGGAAAGQRVVHRHVSTPPARTRPRTVGPAAAVLERVGQRLLHDPVRGEVDADRQRPGLRRPCPARPPARRPRARPTSSSSSCSRARVGGSPGSSASSRSSSIIRRISARPCTLLSRMHGQRLADPGRGPGRAATARRWRGSRPR